MTETYEGLEISRGERIQTIRFARPEKKNALTHAMYSGAAAALREGDASDAVAAHIITGSGGSFTAGNDIGDFLAGIRAGSDRAKEPVREFIRYLPQVQKPLIAAVDGLAVGVGATMLFHCDLVFASTTARISTPFLDLGLVPEAASSLLAPIRMGHARAFELLVLGEPFDAERAREAGIVNRVVEAGELEAAARQAALRLAAKPPAALATSRKLLRGETGHILERLEAESTLFAERLQSPEAKEAFQAFLEKRPADFSKI